MMSKKITNSNAYKNSPAATDPIVIRVLLINPIEYCSTIFPIKNDNNKNTYNIITGADLINDYGKACDALMYT